GAAIWADIDGDGQDEAVAGTENQGVHAFEADGAKLWNYQAEPSDGALSIICPIAAADIDGDGAAEIFAVDQWGPFCLTGGGELRWARPTGDEFLSAPVIADADRDGHPELYIASRDTKAAWCLDARGGTVLWKTATIGGAEVYSGSCIAVGDVDQCGMDEIVMGDALGYVYCLDADGQIRWIYETGKRTHAATSLGDVDGDGAIEVLAASGDHNLYCLDADGQLEWKYAADLRLIYAATIADADNDGKTDILFCGSDRTLRCLTLGGRYRPELVPWPSRRFDAAQSGSCYGKRADLGNGVTESVELLANGGFEQTQEPAGVERFPESNLLRVARTTRPRGWTGETAEGEWAFDTNVKATGERSLKTTAKDILFDVASDVIELDRAIGRVNASILTQGGPASASIRWLGLRGPLGETPLQRADDANGWTRLALIEAAVPRGARWLQFACATDPGAAAYWDEARVTGLRVQPRMARPLVNQVGYDLGAPKRFTAYSNFIAKSAVFSLVGEDGAVAFSAPLQHAGRIQGAYGPDWGYEYWRGDFSAFDTPGTYRVRVTLDDCTDSSWPFVVGKDVLWEKTSAPAYRFFYYQRCGMAIPGFHGACHLDDAVSPDRKTQYELWGGWHDAGDYNTYHNAPYVLGLARAYGLCQTRFDTQDADGNGISDFLDEIVWGGDQSRRMIAPDGSAYGVISSGYGFWGPPEMETDNIPGTGDERSMGGAETGNDSVYQLGAMARIARYAADKTPWVEAADRALGWAQKNGQRGPLQFAAVLDLYAATKNPKYAALAKEWFPGANVEVADSVRLYDSLFGEDHSAALRDALVARVESMLPLAENPFGVCAVGWVEHPPLPPFKEGDPEKLKLPNFFGTPADQGGWHVGTSSYVLNAATIAAMAYRYESDPRYLAFAYDQFNWILGNNPYDISLMEGQGSANPPTYHHRYTFSGVPRGAVPGSVVNGITWRAAGDDRPYFDLRGLDIPAFEPNEVWLPHNTAYLNALANLASAQN
ncbi:MAG: hypothetical protein QG656_2105, partial [Candidatus Hydrogenedentes bacterium]|nr:hypothetical protein [Candidatus Hydrogenedentota bacterium]